MIFYVIGVLILLLSIKYYRKAFLLFLVYRLILTTNIAVLSSPGLPLLTLDMFLTMWFAGLYLIKRPRYNKGKMKLPLLFPMNACIVAWLASSLFSTAGIRAEISSLVGNILQDYILLIMIWEIVERKQELDSLVKGFTLMFLACCVYGLIEYGIKRNPLLQYELTLIHDASKAVNYDYSLTLAATARGYRIRSAFEHPIGAGINFALYALFIGIAVVRYNEKLKRPLLIVITTVLTVPCLVLTKMRGPLLFLIIAAVGLVEIKRKRLYKYAVIGGLVLWAVATVYADNLNVFLSLFNANAQREVGGSNIEMRLLQLNAAWALLRQSPLFGLGHKFLSVVQNTYTYQLYGQESIWFKVMPEYGLLGVAAYVIKAVYEIIIVPRKFHSKQLFFLALAYWVTASATSLPGMQVYLYYLLMFYIIKKSSLYNQIKTGRVQHVPETEMTLPA